MLQPRASESIGFLLGIPFWGIHVGLILFILVFTQQILANVSFINHINPWIRLILAGIIGTAAFVPIGLWLDIVFLGESYPTGLGFALFEEFLAIAPKSTLCWVAINAPLELKLSFNGPEEKANKPISFIPNASGQNLWALSSELHYLRVRTDKGMRLILYSLSDAISELGGQDGIQVHRSHWVSRLGVKELIKSDGSDFFVLQDGTQIPISRRRLKETKNWWSKHV